MENIAAKITIETTDKELVYALWDLQSDQIRIEEQLHKAIGVTEICACISAGSGIVSAVAAVINITFAYRKKSAENTKATAYITQCDEGLRVILDQTKGEITVVYCDNREN